jgi:hypothetical protein
MPEFIMYVTLDFHIQAASEGGYRLEVFQRGTSQPLAQHVFHYEISYLTQFEIKQLDVDARDPQGRLERLQAFGVKLYQLLFTKAVRGVWESYKKKAPFLELCLRIAPEARELEALPWETLYDGEEYLAAGGKTGVSRLPLDVPVREGLPGVPPPVKMLAFIASPLDLGDHERLRIEEEQEILLQAVNDPAGLGLLELVCEDEAKLPVLETSLEDGYHILHYSGHGIPPEAKAQIETARQKTR